MSSIDYVLPHCLEVLLDRLNGKDIFCARNQLQIKKARNKLQHLSIKDQRFLITSVANVQKLTDDEVKYFAPATFDMVVMKYFVHKMDGPGMEVHKFVLFECLSYLGTAILGKEKLSFENMKPSFPRRSLDDVANYMKVSKSAGLRDDLVESMVDGFNNCVLDDDVFKLENHDELDFFRSWLIYARFPKFFSCIPHLKVTSFIQRRFVKQVLPVARKFAMRMCRRNRKFKAELSDCFRILELSIDNKNAPMWQNKRGLRERNRVRVPRTEKLIKSTSNNVLRIEKEVLQEICDEVSDGQNRQLSQTDLLFQSRDAVAMTELKNGNLALHVVSCNPKRYDKLQMRYLLEAFQIFQLSLTNMPAKYMARLVFDPRHRCLCLVKTATNSVCGAICFRPFKDQNFSEIVFCAVSSDEQVKGYGTFLMNHLKDHHISKRIFNLLTYADENAVGYFRKQGFTSAISMDKGAYTDFIKSYDGATLMQCNLDTRINYSHLSTILKFQTDVIDQLKKKQSQPAIFNGLTAPVRVSSDIPGVNSKS